MKEFDLTVALTAHSETLVAGPTMRSAEIAIRIAEAAGFRIERLIGLDAPSDEGRAFFCQPAFANWRVEKFQSLDPYPTRNALAERASGRWVAFLDADDLFSENWLVAAGECLIEAEKANGKVIVHPEMHWVFDNDALVFTKPAQDDPLFVPEHFYVANYYDMLCMAPREAYRDVPYVSRDLVNGFGYGDWQWNIETMAAGWRHVVAKDTIIFKRRRDYSVVLQNEARQTVIFHVESMAIDRVRKLGRSPEGLAL